MQKHISRSNMSDEYYQCKRCGHKSSQKSNLESHLKKQTACQAKVANIDRAVLLEELKSKPKPKSSPNEGLLAMSKELAKIRKVVANLVGKIDTYTPK